MPGLVYVTKGFCEFDVWPSPKFQNQVVGLPVERSVNCAWTALHFFVTDTLKSAVGWVKERVIVQKKQITGRIML